MQQIQQEKWFTKKEAIEEQGNIVLEKDESLW